MALTLTKTADGVMGDRRYWIGVVAFDASYPTGGEAIAAADLGFENQIDAVLAGGSDQATFRPVWDPSAGTLMLFIEDGTSGIEAEAGNTTDQSAVTDIQVVAFGQ